MEPISLNWGRGGRDNKCFFVLPTELGKCFFSLCACAVAELTLALMCSFIGLKFNAFAFALPCSSSFAQFFALLDLLHLYFRAHNRQKRTNRRRQAEEDRQKRTGRRGQAEEDRQYRTGRKDRQKRIGRRGQAEEDRQKRTGSTEQAEQDSQNRTARVGQLE
jgi:hypothetical protein